MILEGAPLQNPKSATILQAFARAKTGGLVFVDLHEQETSFSWQEIAQRAKKAAATLRARGVKKGDRVAIILPTSIAFADAFFGTLFAGAVPVPLYPPVRLGRLDEYFAATTRMIRTAKAKIVVSDARVGKLLGRVIADVALPMVALPLVEPLPMVEPLPLVQTLESDAEVIAEVAADDLALIQFSSGSTVDPKAVALTHRNLMAQCEALKEMIIPNVPGDAATGVCWLPLYHDMGLIGCVLSALYYPGKLVLIPPEIFLAKPALWLRAISRHKAVISPAPDFAYSLCARVVKDRDLEGVDLSSWYAALNGAEPIVEKSLQRFVDRFSPYGFKKEAMRPVYGLSEASLAVTASSPPYKLRDGKVCVGKPVPGCALKIEDGRIFVRGVSVMRGYFDDDRATQKALNNGWLDTGDRGEIIDGELYVTGRDKDVIIVRGQNHAPQEFEACLLEQDGIRTGCAVALPFSDDNGEGVLILAERAPNASAQTAEEASARILEKTGIKPKRVQLLAPGTLPRTSSGKMRRQEALRRYKENALMPPNKVSFARILGEMVRSQFFMWQARWRTRSTVSRPGARHV